MKIEPLVGIQAIKDNLRVLEQNRALEELLKVWRLIVVEDGQETGADSDR